LLIIFLIDIFQKDDKFLQNLCQKSLSCFLTMFSPDTDNMSYYFAGVVQEDVKRMILWVLNYEF